MSIGAAPEVEPSRDSFEPIKAVLALKNPLDTIADMVARMDADVRSTVIGDFFCSLSARNKNIIVNHTLPCELWPMVTKIALYVGPNLRADLHIVIPVLSRARKILKFALWYRDAPDAVNLSCQPFLDVRYRQDGRSADACSCLAAGWMRGA